MEAKPPPAPRIYQGFYSLCQDLDRFLGPRWLASHFGAPRNEFGPGEFGLVSSTRRVLTRRVLPRRVLTRRVLTHRVLTTKFGPKLGRDQFVRTGGRTRSPRDSPRYSSTSAWVAISAQAADTWSSIP